MPTVHWFRRDLRLSDNPALLAAVERARAEGDGRVTPLFVLDPVLWDPAGDVRRAALVASLTSLSESLGGRLLVRSGRPESVVAEVARSVGAREVHVASDFAPYGAARDGRVETALSGAGAELVRTGSPYAVAPGRVCKGDGTPYRVYTPFYRAWLTHGWRAPALGCPPDIEWHCPPSTEALPASPDLGALVLPPAGEAAAVARWHAFRDEGLARYDERRDLPAVAGTSGLSAALKWGEIHPRTLLRDLADQPDSEGVTVFRKEIAWREFYADVLLHHPRSVTESLDPRFAEMQHDEGDLADSRFDAWCHGRTGYPFVDAGMRQLLAEGWMHNRVRMVVASFLVKDLHLPWWRGAEWFMRWLRDGDVASNQHGWQWAAGCGTDASPYFRVFNPVSQGLRFDPAGDYVRAYIPELRHLSGKSAHEPWSALGQLGGPAGDEEGYPTRIVDHALEREESLRRFASLPRRT